MALMSRYLQTQILEWANNTKAMPARPGDLYLALYSNDPGETDTGTEISTVISTAGRVAVPFDPPIASATGGSISNTAPVIYTLAANGNGAVTHGAFFDAQAGGNMLFYFPWQQTINISTNDPLTFGTNRITISGSGVLGEYVFNLIWDWLRDIADFPTPPANLYLAPFSTDPGFQTTGTEITSIILASPNRPIVLMNTLQQGSNFTRILNSQAYNFGNAQNNAAISHLAWFDAQTAGNQIARTPLDVVVSLSTGEPFIVGLEKISFGIR